jgi:hypothetical protein
VGGVDSVSPKEREILKFCRFCFVLK